MGKCIGNLQIFHFNFFEQGCEMVRKSICIRPGLYLTGWFLVVCDLCLKITGDVGVLGAEQALAHVNHYLAGQTVLPLPLSWSTSKIGRDATFSHNCNKKAKHLEQVDVTDIMLFLAFFLEILVLVNSEKGLEVSVPVLRGRKEFAFPEYDFWRFSC